MHFGRRRPTGDTSLSEVGRLAPIRTYKLSTIFEDSQLVCANIPELAEYTLAPQSAASERFALCELYSYLRDDHPESLPYLYLANQLATIEVGPVSRPAWFDRMAPDFVDFLTACSGLAMDKHPGYPACRLGNTKGQVFTLYTVDLYQAVLVRMVCLELVAPACVTTRDFVRTYCSDLFAVSIKHEVVKVGKSGRVLNASSIVTEIVERLLYDPYTQRMLDTKLEHFSAVGIGFTPDDATLLCTAQPVPVSNSDVPKFDSTVTPVEAFMSVQHVESCYGGVPPGISLIMRGLEASMQLKAFIFGDGVVFVQNKPGGQATGRKMTTSFNTAARARRSLAVSAHMFVSGVQDVSFLCTCAGDDCGEGAESERERTYARLGFPLRDYQVSDVIEFCSHSWQAGEQPVAQRFFKAVANLCMHDLPTLEQLDSFVLEFHRHPDFSGTLPRILACRPGVKFRLNEMNFRNEQRAALAAQLRAAPSGPVGDDLKAPVYLACAKKKRGPLKKTPSIKGRGDYTDADRKLLKEINSKLPDLSLSSVGRKLGSKFGMGDLGEVAGKGLASIFGMGDYTVSTNSLMKLGNPSANDVPVFTQNGKRGVRVTEREFLMDVRSGPSLDAGSTPFHRSDFRINPSDAKTFPWLHRIADSYDQYEIKGLIFEFVSTSSDFNGASQALGTVIMATEYDPSDAPYESKIEMENAGYANSTKPSQTAIHGIECDPVERATTLLYTGYAPAGQEKFYDLGRFSLATQGCSTANQVLGELWVSYDIVFYKKHLQLDAAYAYSKIGHSGDTVEFVNPWWGANPVWRGGSSDDIKYNLLVGPEHHAQLSFPRGQTRARYLITAAHSADYTGHSSYPESTYFPNVNRKNASVIFYSAENVGNVRMNIFAIVDVTGPESCITIGAAHGGESTSISYSLITISSLDLDQYIHS